jgi:hypothetical protein
LQDWSGCLPGSLRADRQDGIDASAIIKQRRVSLTGVAKSSPHQLEELPLHFAVSDRAILAVGNSDCDIVVLLVVLGLLGRRTFNKKDRLTRDGPSARE